MNGNGFLTDIHLLDEQANDFLPLFVAELLHALIELGQERLQRLIQLDPPLVFHRAQSQALALLLQRSDLLP